MTNLARPLWLSIWLLVFAGPFCAADTTTELRKVFTFMPPPQYPAEAWERRSSGWQPIEGKTICRVLLDARGVVTGVQIRKSSGHKALDAAGVTALRRWRAKPGPAGRFYDIPLIFAAGAVSAPRPPVPDDGLGLSRGR